MFGAKLRCNECSQYTDRCKCHPLDAAPVPASTGRVPIPTNTDQAVGMVLVGMAWLKEHAPERLVQPVAARELDVEAERELFKEAVRQVYEPRLGKDWHIKLFKVNGGDLAFKMWQAARTAAQGTAPAKILRRCSKFGHRCNCATDCDPSQPHPSMSAQATQPESAPVSTEKAGDAWQVVPRVITDDMHIAFAEAWFSKVRPIDDHDMQDAYAAMLDAAPSPNNSPVRGKD